MSARGVARALVQCSSDFFDFLAPHRLSVQKVQMSLIMLNCVQVSPPPPNRITTPYSFPVLPQADKEFTIQVNLHNWFARPENLVFCSPPPLSAKSSIEFDYAKLCSGVPTTRRKNYDSICIHWVVNGLRRSPPRAKNFGQKPSINH